MRKLLILAAGATLLAAPAFAQSNAGSSAGADPNKAGQTSTLPTADQGGSLGPSSVQPYPNADGSSPAYDNAQPAKPNGDKPVSGAGADGMSSGGANSNGSDAMSSPTPNTNGSDMSGGTRMYSATGGNGDVQVVSNGPVPDTAANRAKYRPLSHAGRRTKAGGN
jgi:hypothetical protein